MKKALVLTLACALLLTAALPVLATSYEPVVHPAQRGASELLKDIVKTANPSASSGFWSLAQAVYGKLDAAVLSNEFVPAETSSGSGFVRVTDDADKEEADVLENEEEPVDETEEEVTDENGEETADEETEEPADEEPVEEEPVDEEPIEEEPVEEPVDGDMTIDAYWDALPDGEDTLGNTLKLKHEDIPEGEDSYVKLARGGYLWYGDAVYKFDLPGVGYTYCYADKIGGGSFYKYYTYEEAFDLEAWVKVFPAE